MQVVFSFLGTVPCEKTVNDPGTVPGENEGDCPRGKRGGLSPGKMRGTVPKGKDDFSGGE